VTAGGFKPLPRVEDAPAVAGDRSTSTSVVVVHGADSATPAWGAEAVTVPVPADTDGADGTLAAAARSFAEAECVLIDAATVDALAVARRVHRSDADVQVVAVGDDERRRAMERAMLFTPGIGELWLAGPREVGTALIERAASVTRQRRKYRRTRDVLERAHPGESPQRTQRALISDAYLADLLQVLYDPVFSIDYRGRILSANPAAGQLLGRSDSELVGASLASVLGTVDEGYVTALLESATDAPSTSELSFRTASGERGHAELLVTRVRGSEPRLFAVVLHDLTERHRAQQRLEDQAMELEHQSQMLQEQTAELEQANEDLMQQRLELEAALATRSRFYASMSHELRTPINAVIGYIGLVLEGVYGPLPERMHDALSRSKRAAAHLHELVDDVLDLAKLEAGRIDVTSEPVDVRPLAEDILLSVRPAAEANGSSVSLECDGDAPEPIVTDPRRVRQILLNLLGNALKFGAGRPVVLRCRSSPDGVTFSVTDQGPGIPKADQPRIFEEFVQLDPEGRPGTGLGLSISRRLAQLLGGTLTVSSVEGEGSTFSLSLPRANSTSGLAPAARGL
jgi:PAS domain S-box-containing protein